MLIVSEKASKLEYLQYLFAVIACVKRIWEFFFEYCALFRKHQLKTYLPKVIYSKYNKISNETCVSTHRGFPSNHWAGGCLGPNLTMYEISG